MKLPFRRECARESLGTNAASLEQTHGFGVVPSRKNFRPFKMRQELLKCGQARRLDEHTTEIK